MGFFKHNISLLVAALFRMTLTAAEEVYHFGLKYDHTGCSQTELQTLDDFLMAVGYMNGFKGVVGDKRRLVEIQKTAGRQRDLKEQGVDYTAPMLHELDMLDILDSLPEDYDERRLSCYDECGTQCVTEWQQLPWVSCCPCCLERCRRRDLQEELSAAGEEATRESAASMQVDSVRELQTKMEEQCKSYCYDAANDDVLEGDRLGYVDCDSVEIKTFGWIDQT